jgi:hypothetical protein
MRRPNPSSLLWGLSPFIPGRKSVLFNRYSQEYLNSFYQKGAIPGFALTMDKEANEKNAIRLLKSFETAYTGRRNMRRTLLLPKGVGLQETAHTLANQELAIYIDKNRETIINILRVPKHKLSLQEAGSLGSQEAKIAMKNFWYSALIPTMGIIAGEQTRFFRQRGLLAPDLALEFDLSKVEALQEDQSDKADLAKKYLDSGWSLNEVRTKVWELPASTESGADVPFVIRPKQESPFIPFGLSASRTPQMTPALSGGSHPAELAAGASETTTASLDEGDDKAAPPVKVKAEAGNLSTYLKSNGWWDRREATVAEEAQKGFNVMEKRVLKMFADMASTIIRITRGYLVQKAWQPWWRAWKPATASPSISPSTCRRPPSWPALEPAGRA